MPDNWVGRQRGIYYKEIGVFSGNPRTRMQLSLRNKLNEGLTVRILPPYVTRLLSMCWRGSLLSGWLSQLCQFSCWKPRPLEVLLFHLIRTLKQNRWGLSLKVRIPNPLTQIGWQDHLGPVIWAWVVGSQHKNWTTRSSNPELVKGWTRQILEEGDQEVFRKNCEVNRVLVHKN